MEHYDLLAIQGNAQHLQGKTEAAEAAYLAAGRLQQLDPKLLNNLAYLWANEERNLEQAEEYARAVVNQMEVASHYDTLSLVLLKAGSLGGAREAIETALSMPDSANNTTYLERKQLIDKLIADSEGSLQTQ